MATHVIINARSRQVRASLDVPGDGTTIFAVDLAGDSWDDYTYFRDRAGHYQAGGDFQQRNRYVRVAISALFSHLDGIVGEVYRMIARNDPSFPPISMRKMRTCSLQRKMLAIRDYLCDKKAAPGLDINLDLKLVRDIVNHPSIIKTATDDATRDTLTYDAADVYGVSLADIDQAGQEIDAWVEATCSASGYERFIDTAALCANFARALGAGETNVRRF